MAQASYMYSTRITSKKLPSGKTAKVFPFHISLEGLETAIICRDEEDYDALVKCIHVCAQRMNVIVVIYIAVSNHGHIVILCESQDDADKYGQELKRIHSMWISRKYGAKNIMAKTDVKAIYLDTDWYLRNALAYVARNALDNCTNIDTYKWSGYRAMFSGHSSKAYRMVSSLSTRESERIFHTNYNLSKVSWAIDANEELIPRSCCDYCYLENAFNGDQAYFLKTIGNLNYAQMKNKLIDSPRTSQNDNEFDKTVRDICTRWYNTDLEVLCLEKKIRIIPYVYRTVRTGIPQLSRIFGLSREQISAILRIKKAHSEQ